MAAAIITIIRHKARIAAQSFSNRVEPNNEHPNSENDSIPVTPNPCDIRIDAVQPHENLMAEQCSSRREWTFRLFCCFEDITATLMTMVCPCVAAGEIYRQGLDKSFVGGAGWYLIIHIFPLVFYFMSNLYLPIPCLVYPCLYSRPLRLRRNIDGDPFKDFCLYLCCCPCQMCRELREAKDIRSRGVLNFRMKNQKEAMI